MEEGKKSKVALIIVIAIIVAIIVGVGVYFGVQAISTNMLKGETITAENYKELMEKLGDRLEGKDDLYYLTFAMSYNMMKDGIASAFTNPGDENAMFASIYGKTVQQLIDEGKRLMDENGITIEQFKEEIENQNSNILDNLAVQ